MVVHMGIQGLLGFVESPAMDQVTLKFFVMTVEVSSQGVLAMKHFLANMTSFVAFAVNFLVFVQIRLLLRGKVAFGKFAFEILLRLMSCQVGFEFIRRKERRTANIARIPLLPVSDLVFVQ